MEYIEDNASKFIDDPFGNASQFVDDSFDNASMFIDDPIDKPITDKPITDKPVQDNTSKFIGDPQGHQIVDFVSKLSDSLNSSLSQNIPVDWDKVISYSQQLGLMAESMKNNDLDTLDTLSKQDIEVHTDYHIENEKKFL